MDDSTVQICLGAGAVVLVAVLLIGAWRWSSQQPAPESSPLMICATCGSFGHPKTTQPGSMLIAVILLLLFIIPGIFYILWQQAATRRVCPSCGSTELVPHDSPRGIKLQNEFHAVK